MKNTPARSTRTPAERALAEVETAQRIHDRAYAKLAKAEAAVAAAHLEVDAANDRLVYARQNPAYDVPTTTTDEPRS